MAGELLLALAALIAMSRSRIGPVRPILAAAALLSAVAMMSVLLQGEIGRALLNVLPAFTDITAIPRSSPVSGFILFMLVIATAVAVRDGHRASRVTVFLASLVLGVAFIAGVGVPLTAGRSAGEGVHRLMSGFAASPAIALSAGLIGWRHRTGWPHLSWDRRIEGTVLGTILSLCIVTPVSFALLRRWTIITIATPWPVAEALQVGAQIIVSTAILFWAWSRISSENIARRETTRALDAAPIALVTTTGEIVHWSEGCERLYQWTAQEAKGRLKHELLGSSSGRWKALTASLLPGHSCEYELLEHRRDGIPLRVIEQARLMPGGEGRPATIILSMTDITARARAEEALRASEARLTLAVEALELGLFEWERHGDVLMFSPAVIALTGIGGGCGLGAWLRRLQSHFDIEIFPNERLVLRQRVPRCCFRMRRIRHDGALTTIEGVVRCIHGPDGKLIRMTGVMFDTSAREQGAAALQARESELATILEHVPDAMLTVDGEGRIRSFSTTAESLLGYSAADVIGRDVKLLIPERHHALHNRNLNRHLATGQPYLNRQRHSTTVCHRDGHEIPIELAVGEADIGQERIFIAFLRDLSEQVAAQTRLTELRDELVHVSRLSALGEMAAGLAHELNQPLAATVNFLGAADMLLDGDKAIEADRVLNLVKMASGEALRAGQIMRRIRSFASRGTVTIQPEILAEVLREATAMVLTDAEWRRYRIRFDLDPGCRLILADRVQIQQVVINLVRNAIEAVAERPGVHPDIFIASRGVDEGMVEILVNDNGPGIAPEVLRRQLAPFYSTKADGMGIGLSICRRIIELHGGQFAVENRPEGGATMRFTIPRANGDIPAGL